MENIFFLISTAIPHHSMYDYSTTRGRYKMNDGSKVS